MASCLNWPAASGREHRQGFETLSSSAPEERVVRKTLGY
jgi:hypothetical protein